MLFTSTSRDIIYIDGQYLFSSIKTFSPNAEIPYCCPQISHCTLSNRRAVVVFLVWGPTLTASGHEVVALAGLGSI